MKALIKILLGGFALFMVLAITQEWDFFSSAWFGNGEGESVELAPDDRQAAAEAVRLSLNLMRHFYMAGGDPRFAERMPVAAGILEEMQSDIDYLRANQRLQDPQLRKLDILEVMPLSEDRAEVRTREFWRYRSLWIDGSGEADPEEWQISFGRYLVSREATGWRVVGWELDEPPQSEDQG